MLDVYSHRIPSFQMCRTCEVHLHLSKNSYQLALMQTGMQNMSGRERRGGGGIPVAKRSVLPSAICLKSVFATLGLETNRDHLLTKGYILANFEVQATFNSWDIVFTNFWYWPMLTPNDLLTSMKNNRDHLLTKPGVLIYQVWSSSNFCFLIYRVYKVWRLWPLLT